jgi:hypothetical protein
VTSVVGELGGPSSEREGVVAAIADSVGGEEEMGEIEVQSVLADGARPEEFDSGSLA